MPEYSTLPLLDALVACVTAAWDPAKIIEDVEVPTYDAGAALNYVVIACEEITASLNGPGASVSNQWEHNPFRIVYRFPLPANSSDKLARVKVRYLQAFRDQFQSAAQFAGVGQFPLITKASFKRLSAPDEGAGEIEIECEVWTSSKHH